MQLCSHHNPRTVQRGNDASVVGPLRKLEDFSDERLIHLLFTIIFCTMGHRNFYSKASVQKFLCPIVQKNFYEK